MAIWKTECSVEQLNKLHENTMVDFLGMEVIALDDDTLTMRMPVDHRTKQLFGIMHGGASAALAETAGSVAANLCVDSTTHHAVGLDINTSHIKQVREGYVHGVAKAIHLGRSTQIWEIRTFDDQGNLVSLSRLTMAILEKRLNKM